MVHLVHGYGQFGKVPHFELDGGGGVSDIDLKALVVTRVQGAPFRACFVLLLLLLLLQEMRT